MSCVRIFVLARATPPLDVTSPASMARHTSTFAPMSFALSFTHAVAPTTSGLRRGTHAMRCVSFAFAAQRRASERCERERARAGARRRRACAREMARDGARDGATGGATARVGIVEKNSLRRRARVFARDVRRRGRQERMRD